MRYVYAVQGNYNTRHGWETVTTEETLSEATETVATYRDNEPMYRFRVRRVREEQ